MPLDKKIIEGFRDGEVESFDKIYRLYSKKLLYFTLGLVKDLDISKDLVQEVFVNLWEKRGQVDSSLNFENYLFTISYNSIRKFFRNRSFEEKNISQLLYSSPESIDSIEGSMIYDELLKSANAAIEKLPPQRQNVYKLSRQEGMKNKEIAIEMNISCRTVENHLSKALKHLREELAGITLLTLLFLNLFL